MCLTSQHFLPKIAKTDKVCYKTILVEKQNGIYHFISPYVRYEFDKSIAYKHILKPDLSSYFGYFVDLILGFIQFLFTGDFEVCGGFIHAYAEKRTTSYTLFKCHIPKGSLYYEEDNGVSKYYAASKIIIDDFDDTIKKYEDDIIKKELETKKHNAYLKELKKQRLEKKEKQRHKKIILNEKKQKRKNKRK